MKGQEVDHFQGLLLNHCSAVWKQVAEWLQQRVLLGGLNYYLP